MTEYLIGKIDKSDIFKALKTGFSHLIPITLCTSFFVLLANIPDEVYIFMLRNNSLVKEIKTSLNLFFISVYSFISIIILIFVSYSYSKIKEIGSIYGTSFTLLTFLILNNVFLSEGKIIFEERFYNSSNIFFALIVSIITPYFLQKLSNVKIRHFDSKNIPEDVSQNLNAIVPSMIYVSGLFIFKFLLFKLNLEDLNKIVETFIQQPIQNISDTMFSVVLVNFLKNFLWVFGINGSQIIGAIVSPIINSTTLSNLSNYMAGDEVSYIFTTPFQDAFANFGGSGCTIALFVSYMIFGSNLDIKKLFKLSFIPLLFNINEPLVYGLPIIMNPILALPFILVPTLNSGIAYVLIQNGLVTMPHGIIFPWITPIFISGFLASGFSGVLLQFFLLLIDVFIYKVFIKKYDESIKNRVLDVDDLGGIL